MADKFLSQEEIDLLLQSLGKEAGEEEAVIDTSQVKAFDLNSLEHVSMSRVAGLELIIEKWVRNVKTSLATIVVNLTDVRSEEITLIKFSDFILKIPLPSAIAILNINPLKGSSFLVVDPKLIFVIVSSIFGGSPKPYKVEGKEFTRVEMRIIKRVVEVLVKSFEEAWNIVIEGNIEIMGIEVNPKFLTVASPRERFIVSRITIDIEGFEGFVYMAIPERGIEPFKEKLRNVSEIDIVSVKENLIDNMKNVPVKLEASLGETVITIQDLLNLEEGHVLKLNTHIKEPIKVKIQGVPKLKAILGESGTMKAIKILEFMEEE